MELNEIFRNLLKGEDVKLAVYNQKERSAKLIATIKKQTVENGLDGFTDEEIKQIKNLVRRKMRDSDCEVQASYQGGCRSNVKSCVRKDVLAKRLKEYSGWCKLDTLLKDVN